MIEHASELIPALWASIVFLVTCCGIMVRWMIVEFRRATVEQTDGLTKRLDQVTARLSGQDAQLSSIRDLLADEVFNLRELIHSVDKRVLTIEGRCEMLHHHIRKTDFTGSDE